MSLFESAYVDPVEATYRILRSQQRARRFALFLKVAIILGLYFGYQYLQQPENAAKKEALIEAGQTKLESFITPIAERLATNLTKKIQADMLSGAAGTVRTAGAQTQQAALPSNINPAQIQAICSALSKNGR
jgi:hypothetical protein